MAVAVCDTKEQILRDVAEIPVAVEVDWSVFTAPMKVEKGLKLLYFNYKYEGS